MKYTQAILVAPVALFGLFHKTRLHFMGVQYKTADGKNAGLLLQGDIWNDSNEIIGPPRIRLVTQRGKSDS